MEEDRQGVQLVSFKRGGFKLQLAVAAAASLAGTCAKDGKTLVFTTSVPLCDKIVDELKKEHQR